MKISKWDSYYIFYLDTLLGDTTEEQPYVQNIRRFLNGIYSSLVRYTVIKQMNVHQDVVSNTHFDTRTRPASLAVALTHSEFPV